MLDSLVRVSRRVGKETEALSAADGRRLPSEESEDQQPTGAGGVAFATDHPDTTRRACPRSGRSLAVKERAFSAMLYRRAPARHGTGSRRPLARAKPASEVD